MGSQCCQRTGEKTEMCWAYQVRQQQKRSGVVFACFIVILFSLLKQTGSVYKLINSNFCPSEEIAGK